MKSMGLTGILWEENKECIWMLENKVTGFCKSISGVSSCATSNGCCFTQRKAHGSLMAINTLPPTGSPLVGISLGLWFIAGDPAECGWPDTETDLKSQKFLKWFSSALTLLTCQQGQFRYLKKKLRSPDFYNSIF